jgi:hypothetical protein
MNLDIDIVWKYGHLGVYIMLKALKEGSRYIGECGSVVGVELACSGHRWAELIAAY